MVTKDRQVYEFGPFRMDPDHRQLLRENRPLALQPKAFDILLVLVQNSDTVVLKDELLKAVWPETFVEESNLAQNIFVLRKTLGEPGDKNRYIVTVPGRGYRFAEKVRVVGEHEKEDKLIVESHSRSHVVIEEQAALAAAEPVPASKQNLRTPVLAISVVALVVALAAAYFYTHQAPKLTAKDTLVLADFSNSTGDPVFDGTLKQALALQLEQSPFLNLLSDQRVAQTLARMDQPKDVRLTHDVAREVCQRTASSGVLDGSIAQFDRQYLLTLKAINCSTGDSLASAEARASDKDHVLDALGSVSTEIRKKLGESLSSVQKYDVPPQDVTTPSLAALQSYSQAMKVRRGDSVLPIQLFERAIQQDPSFAMAYAQLGVIYVNISETARGADNIRKAYALRDHVSEREKFYISCHYDDMVTGDLEAARRDYELWQQIYPRDPIPPANLATVYFYVGDFSKVLDYVERAIDLSGPPTVPTQPSINLIWSYILLNRLPEAKAMALSAQTHHVDDPLYHSSLYIIDFLQQDAEARKHELQVLADNPTWGDAILSEESDTAAYQGRFAEARDFTRRAVAFAQKSDRQQTAAAHLIDSAIREAAVGNAGISQQLVKQALALSQAKDIAAMSAVASSLAGDSRQTTQLITDLNKRFPQDTVVQLNYLPTVLAATELRAGNASKAIAILAPAAPYELGVTALDQGISLYPVYVRGEAYLATKQGSAAAAEFQKIVDHPGIVQNEIIGALAQLDLARAYVLRGDTSKAKQEYQRFLSLWKNADSDLPLLAQAKSEYAKLPVREQ
jgi:eukaryotic-like serine/threonine-protein kinase